MAGRKSGRKTEKRKTKGRRVVPRSVWLSILLAWAAALFIAVFFAGIWALNSYYVSEAKKGVYHPEMERYISLLHLPDEYIILYNIGNYYFDKENYKRAETYYRLAIDSGIPYGKECDVKVNLALAMLSQLSDEEWDAFYSCAGPETMNAEARTVEKTLKNARDVLLEDGCAGDEEDGHDKDAQKLKEEIDEILEEADLDPDDGDDEGEDETEPEEEPDEEEEDDEPNEAPDQDEVMDHIQELLDEAQEERDQDREFYENFYGYGTDGETGVAPGGEVW